MGLSSIDQLAVADGQIYFIPSGSTTTGISQSVNSVSQVYAVTMSGASLSQSVLAPVNATSSFFYLRQPDNYSFKIYFNAAITASEGVDYTGSRQPTGSSQNLPNVTMVTPSSSVVEVNIPLGTTGSIIHANTVSALLNHERGKNRFIVSGSDNKYIFITNLVSGEPPADDISFSHISGSSVSYNVVTSGSGLPNQIATEGFPDTGSATATFGLDDADKTSVTTALPDSRSFMNVRDGFFGVNVTNAMTGSNISMHGGIPLDIGLGIFPNPAYIKTVGGFDILIDSANNHDDTSFRVFKNTGVPGISPGEELLKISDEGNLTTSGSIIGGTF